MESAIAPLLLSGEELSTPGQPETLSSPGSAQVLVDGLPADPELEGQRGLRGAVGDPRPQLRDLLGVQGPGPGPGAAGRRCACGPARCLRVGPSGSVSARTRRTPPSPPAAASPSRSSPVKVSCSFRNCTRTPRTVRVRTRARRSSRLRARRSIECTRTVSPSRTKASNPSSCGRAVLRPDALPVTCCPAEPRRAACPGFWSRAAEPGVATR